MMPPPTTPTRRGRRSPPRSRTPAKPRTPSGGLAALRLGEEAGDDVLDRVTGEGEDGAKLTPRKTKAGGPNRTLEMVSLLLLWDKFASLQRPFPFATEGMEAYPYSTRCWEYPPLRRSAWMVSGWWTVAAEMFFLVDV